MDRYAVVWASDSNKDQLAKMQKSVESVLSKFGCTSMQIDAFNIVPDESSCERRCKWIPTSSVEQLLDQSKALKNGYGGSISKFAYSRLFMPYLSQLSSYTKLLWLDNDTECTSSRLFEIFNELDGKHEVAACLDAYSTWRETHAKETLDVVLSLASLPEAEDLYKQLVSMHKPAEMSAKKYVNSGVLAVDAVQLKKRFPDLQSFLKAFDMLVRVVAKKAADGKMFHLHDQSFINAALDVKTAPSKYNVVPAAFTKDCEDVCLVHNICGGRFSSVSDSCKAYWSFVLAREADEDAKKKAALHPQEIDLKTALEHSLCISIRDKQYSMLCSIFKEAGLVPLPRKYKGFMLQPNPKDRKIVDVNGWTKGKTNCTFSHMSAVKMAKFLDWPCVLVLEEDAWPCFNAARKLEQYLAGIPDDIHLLVLGNVAFNSRGKHEKDSRYDKIGLNYGSHAYIVFKSGYDEYLDCIDSNSLNAIDDIFPALPHAYSTSELLFAQCSMYQSMSLQESGCPKIAHMQIPQEELKKRFPTVVAVEGKGR